MIIVLLINLPKRLPRAMPKIKIIIAIKILTSENAILQLRIRTLKGYSKRA